MRVIQITPGSGDSFYCENCLRDKATLRAMRDLGHDVIMLPLYLPIGPDEFTPSMRPGVFFGGINVYLQQKAAFFRKSPRWMDRLFDSPGLLRLAGRLAGMTSPGELAQTTISMLRGGSGRQKKELDRLMVYLRGLPRPDVACLSNALLIGLAGPIRDELKVPVVCMLQDEDEFVDSMLPENRKEIWSLIAGQAGQVAMFTAPSRYYADLMAGQLGLPREKIGLVRTGVRLEGRPAGRPNGPPRIGFLSRMCYGKGVDLLAGAFVRLAGRAGLEKPELHLAGGWTAADLRLIRQVKDRLAGAGLADRAEFLPNLKFDRRAEFLGGLSVMSVPQRRPSSCGLFVLEALAGGVPFVQPDCGVFPELLERTGGGLLFTPGSLDELTQGLEKIIRDGEYREVLGGRGRRAVLENFSAVKAAEDFAGVCRQSAARAGYETGSQFRPEIK